MALALWLPLALYAQNQPPTLQELVEQAIATDLGLANKHLEIASTEIDQEKLKNAFLPEINLTAKNALSYNSLVLDLPSIGFTGPNLELTNEDYRFTARSNIMIAKLDAEMLLYSGGKVKALQKALAEKKNAQVALLEKDRQEIISIITAAYDQLALLQQVEVVLQESEKRLAENKRIADKALEYGLSTKYEHQKIDVAQALLASKKLEYQGKKELVLKQLELLTGIDPGRLAAIRHELTPILTDASAGQIENRAEIKALEAGILANQYKIKAEKTWIIPKIKAATSLSYIGLYRNKLNGALTDPGVNEIYKISLRPDNLHVFPVFNIGVGMQWTIFDGKHGIEAAKQAKLELQKSENDKANALQKLTLNLANTQNNYQVANAQITLKTEQKQMTENALTQATKEYRLGLIKSLQLIDAESDFENAQLEYIQSVYTQRRAAIELLKATGNLTIEAIEL